MVKIFNVGVACKDTERKVMILIQDSGSRTEFETGAVRDIQEGKGRCDLMPLDVLSALMDSIEIHAIECFRKTGFVHYLHLCLKWFQENHEYCSIEEMLLDVAKHFEEGAKKYGENNWQKGIPLHSYIDSAVRHYLKHRAGITDERHDRAFVWNILCAAWTFQNIPELDDFTVRKEEENASN